MWISTYT
jgi:hypothetical protein